MTRVLKLCCLGLFSLLLVRYVPVYYHTMLFNQYVEDQVKRIRSKAPLTEAILINAEEHNLTVTKADITMTTADSVLRVKVVYNVPVDFFVFQQNMKFSAAGSGLLLRGN
jgi:hypothetical protein